MRFIPPIQEVGRKSLGHMAKDHWPVLLAGFLFLAGVTEVLLSYHFSEQAKQLDLQTHLLQRRYAVEAKASTPISSSQEAGAAIAGAAETQYLVDLNNFFQIAKDSGVSVGLVDYRIESNTKVPLTIRTLDMRLNEDYPKVKAFVSAVLQKLPNASLQELSVDRKDALSSVGNIALKFALAYGSAQPAEQGGIR